MLRLVGGIVAGIVVWGAGVSILNLVARYGWADYAAVEKTMAFTVPMMAVRLSISFVSSLASGAVAARVGNSRTAAVVCGAILLLCFLLIHYMLFNKFPLWYHVIFLLSLPILSVLGGRFVRPRTE